MNRRIKQPGENINTLIRLLFPDDTEIYFSKNWEGFSEYSVDMMKQLKPAGIIRLLKEVLNFKEIKEPTLSKALNNVDELFEIHLNKKWLSLIHI